jgi:hypothetical protein
MGLGKQVRPEPDESDIGLLRAQAGIDAGLQRGNDICHRHGVIHHIGGRLAALVRRSIARC